MSPNKANKDFSELRHRMVEEQLRWRGIEDARVLEAMDRTPRHAFIPQGLRSMAYSDSPLPIGGDQTVSQPYVVAVMTEVLEVGPGDKVLEIGTGSGYQTAILAEMGVEVFTVEYLEELATSAREILESLEYSNIHYRIGDGRAGWPEEAPFDAIIVTAAPDSLPQSLAQQLKPGGKLVIPIGRWDQYLFVYTRQPNGTMEYQKLFAVRFVPLV